MDRSFVERQVTLLLRPNGYNVGTRAAVCVGARRSLPMSSPSRPWAHPVSPSGPSGPPLPGQEGLESWEWLAGAADCYVVSEGMACVWFGKGAGHTPHVGISEQDPPAPIPAPLSSRPLLLSPHPSPKGSLLRMAQELLQGVE